MGLTYFDFLDIIILKQNERNDKYMKRFLRILLLLLALGALSSCGGKNAENENTDGADDKFVMYAEITNVTDKIEVNVYEAEYAEGTYWINTDAGTKITDENENKISRSDLSIGDKIKITYNGQVAMSYPPQVFAREIERINK